SLRIIIPKEREKKTTEKPKKKKKESPFFRAWMNWMQGFCYKKYYPTFECEIEVGSKKLRR
ncbi:MAG: hypothetical protein J0G96_00465, partial [Flavobacteriia bacterium]|nr:hypothetical protein [Flavobacteriia bacterium]